MVKLKEIHHKEEIKNPVLKEMIDYTKEEERVGMFVVLKNDVQKGIMIASKNGETELQMTYFGSHYLLEQALPLYKEAIHKKLALLS